MLKAAVNPPIGLGEYDCGSLSFGLAHEAKRSEEYTQRLRDTARSGRYLILDNGANEIGEGFGGEEFLKMILDIRPQEIILPDVLQDGRKTLTNSYTFLSTMFSRIEGDLYTEEDRTYLQKVNIMGVAQGSTVEEWMNTYLTFLNDEKVDVIGIPFDIDFFITPEEGEAVGIHQCIRRSDNRRKLIYHLDALGLIRKNIHLLGMNNLVELRSLRDVNPLIRSMDTTGPFASGLDLSRPTWTSGNSFIKDWDSLDFTVSEVDQEQKENIKKNLRELFFACNDGQGRGAVLTLE